MRARPGRGRARDDGRRRLVRAAHAAARQGGDVGTGTGAGGGGEPVIPDFGTGSECVRENRFLCVDWVRDHWDDTLQPRLVEHVELTVYAVTIGFGLALAAALVAYRYRRFEAPFGLFSELLYTIPSLALFQLLVPITGLTVTTVEVALVSYTLLILFRNVLTGLQTAPPDVLEAARAMGLTRAQTLLRVELPLAVPSMVAGIRIATVSTISLATIAAFVVPEGLGQPILDGLQIGFNTKFVAAGALAVALAIAVDALLALLQRALTPWTRAGRPA